MSQVMEDGEASVGVSEGEGRFQNSTKRTEDDHLSRMGTELEEDSRVDQQGDGEEVQLSQPEDPTLQLEEEKEGLESGFEDKHLTSPETTTDGLSQPPEGDSSALEETQRHVEELNQLEDVGHQVELSTAQLEEQTRIHQELKRDLEVECQERLKSEAKLMVLSEVLPNLEEKLKSLADQLQEQVGLRTKLQDDLHQARTQLEEQVGLKTELAERVQHIALLEEQTRELAHKLDEEKGGRLKSEADLMVLREMLSNAEEKLQGLHDQLQEQTEKLDWQGKERMQHMTTIQEHAKLHHELALKLEEDRLKSETSLKELHVLLSNKEEQLKEMFVSLSNKEEELKEMFVSLSNKEEELKVVRESLCKKEEEVKDLHDQLREQMEGKKELEEKIDQRMMVSDHASERLPVSSMPWSEEKLELAKLLDEQKTLLAQQMLEAEKLKNAAQVKVGLLNHQVQNLEVLTDIAETMEHVFNAKERAIKQALWIVVQAVCLGMGFMYVVVTYRDPLRSSLQPT